jgi:signal transduction histidine kinase/uncharacterized protein YdeI (YjbR/CyaY-like superfamily)
MTAPPDDTTTDLHIEITALRAERDAAQAREAALAEVLDIIKHSMGDPHPVFEAILDKAHRLCGAEIGGLVIYDGETVRAAATRGYPARLDALVREPRHPNRYQQRLLAGEPLLHIADLAAIDPEQDQDLARILVESVGLRTFVAVPLRKDTTVLGLISAFRLEVRPFSASEITLLESFAAQAVIAMENARLLTEQREALEQQTATAEVLQVINVSPGNLTPVFDAILEKAMRLCGAAFGSLYTYDRERFLSAAQRGVPPAYAAFRAQHPPTTELRSLEHILDARTHELYRAGHPGVRAAVELGGVRTVLRVPLLKDDAPLGYITVYRQEVRAFSDKQIALLEGFAAQAVIAMENARLITEQREALEQQTATADILRVINSSPGNLAPVFEAILEKAHRLCEATKGAFITFDGEYFQVAATRGLSDAYSTVLRNTYNRPIHAVDAYDERSPRQQLLRGADLVHLTGPAIAIGPVGEAAVELEKIGTVLFVPLRRDSTLLGYITAYREEVSPFTDQQIALLKNFAAQAVIAMENARLLDETREALEQQTATAEVLQVINSSPGNLAPVFNAMLDRARRLCGADVGTFWYREGPGFRVVASSAQGDTGRTVIPAPGTSLGRIAHGADLVQIDDVTKEEGYRTGVWRERTQRVGTRTALAVPLRKDDELVGAITTGRREVRRFTENQIGLLQSFATQAVIAMENARLLDEIRQRQAELRVTFDNMGDGVVMFDAEHRLAASNRNFQELLDIPDVMLADRPSYADYLRLLAQRGEFGADDVEAELARRLEDTDRELRLERARPDGRVIEVRRNSVLDGGFVLIYSDITERKRSEAEIRAARDAAEAAYRDLKAAQASLIQAEKMASLGQLTAGIAHEIKNPLNFVNNFASLSVDLLDELKETAAPGFAMLDADRRAEIDDLTRTLSGNLEKINEHGNRADAIVRSMLEHSRGSSGERRSVDLNRLVDKALNLAYHGARAQDQSFNVTLQRDFDQGIAPITLVPQDVTRVLLNLFSNGFYAARRRQSMEGATGWFEPTLKVVTRELGDAVEIRVRDNGIGIPEEVRDKLFQPFFTTKPTGEGTGLGLSISYDIVTQQHGGSIMVESKVGEFSEFTMRLPRHP